MDNEQEQLAKRRNRGGMAEIGTAEDGAIVEMVNINERIITIKEHSIYELVMADTLDPDGKRPNLPPSMHSKLLDRGASDPLVSRTFLTAKSLFSHKYYLDSIDTNKVILLMLDVTRELIAMQEEIDAFNKAYDKACDSYNKRDGVPGYMLPSIPDILSRCKTIFQKADQSCQYLMRIIKMFYPAMKENDYYTHFYDQAKLTYGEADPFYQFLTDTVPFILELKRVRNGFEHNKTELTITGFQLEDDGNVLSPTIEMSLYQGGTIERQDLTNFLSTTMENLMYVIETMIAVLASKHLQPFGQMVPQVRSVPEQERKGRLVRYSIWLPIGPDGFYCQ